MNSGLVSALRYSALEKLSKKLIFIGYICKTVGFGKSVIVKITEKNEMDIFLAVEIV